MKSPRRVGPHQIWAVVFGVWALLLSGLLPHGFGPPGVAHALRLRSLLHSKQAEASSLELEIERLGSESRSLQKSRVAQKREIRRVLGYAAPDEIIFDFTLPDHPGLE